MAIALVTNIQLTGALTGGTTGTTDTTGATLLVLNAGYYFSATGVAVSDNKGNTYTGLTAQSVNEPVSRLYYCANPTVGSGHTFTASGTLYAGGLQVEAFSGVATTSPFDVQNGATISSSASSIATGSVTPSQNNSLIVSGFAAGANSATYSVNSSLSISNQQNYSAGVSEGSAMAYFVQGTAAAINPTWSASSGSTNGVAATIAVFKPSVGGGGPIIRGGPIMHGAIIRGGRIAA